MQEVAQALPGRRDAGSSPHSSSLHPPVSVSPHGGTLDTRMPFPGDGGMRGLHSSLGDRLWGLSPCSAACSASPLRWAPELGLGSGAVYEGGKGAWSAIKAVTGRSSPLKGKGACQVFRVGSTSLQDVWRTALSLGGSRAPPCSPGRQCR